MPRLSAERMVPGRRLVDSPVSRPPNTFTTPAPSRSVLEAGQGISPRIWSWISRAGRVQSMGESSRESMGA